uniref:Large proline-rich protein BAG6 n=1 Tax=Culex tarsalis TaxID=7177 RepID=A0A1Q3G279_CULTA
MINLKVKTLDSQNHDFSVEDDITVRQFKEHIAEKINVAVDMQRLIYCGRVLSDDKPLKEYDVNGKVVHLVQRAPPSARGSSSSSSGGVGNSSLSDEGARAASARRSRSSDNAAASRGQIFRGLDDFNTMYFGSMTSIPLNVNATQTPPQIPTVSPSSTLCMNRITVARHMLQCVDNIISYLETPERGLNNTAMDILSQQTMESTVFEVGISAVGDVDIPPNQMQNFVQAFQGAVSAAFRQNGISNVTVQQQPDTLNPSVQVFGTIPDSAIVTPPNTSATATPAQESSGASSGSSSTSSSTSESSADSRRQARPGGASGSGSSASGSGSSRNQTTSTQTLAEVVQQMRAVQRRMEPFLQQYYEILQNDPTYEERDAAVRENAQRVFDRISEALHYMSHAQHAISDLMLDLQSAAPRHLCCRPILVEQSAFVSSGIAAVPNNINLANLLRATHNNNNPEVGNNNINAQIINLSIPGMPGSAPGGPLTMPPLIPVNPPNRSTTGGTAAAAGSATGATTGTNAAAANTSQPQGQSARRVVVPLPELPDDVVTRVYIPLYDPQTVRRVQSLVQTMGAPDGPRAPPPGRSSSASRSSSATASTTTTTTTNTNNDDDTQRPPMASSSPSSTDTSRTTSESDSVSSGSSPERRSSAANSTNTTATNASNNNNNAQMQMARLIQAVVNATPIHADIHVQINAGGNPPASGAATSSGSGPAAATTTASTESGRNGGGPQANPTMTNNTSTNTNSGGNDGTQSRFATVTLPTTSTQTRSTSRPHVHSIPPAHIRQVRPIPANMLSSFDRFDRFLPCNSHHIRESGDRGPETITLGTSNNSSNNSSSGTTPASAGQPSAPPSESLASLPFNLFGSQFTLADFEQIVPNPNTLNRIRDSLQTYVVQTLFNGEPISEGTMPNAMNELIRHLEPILSLVSRYDLPDYDTRASFENLIRSSVPFCMNLIREDSSQQFGVRLLRFLITFVRRFFMILVVCVGPANAESFSRELFNIAMCGTLDSNNVAPELLRLFLPAIHRQLERSSNHDQQDIQEFLVIRSRPPGEQSGANRGPSPMEVDDTESSTTPELVSDIAEISISIEPPNIVNLDQCAAIVISAGPVTSGSAPSTVRVVAAAPVVAAPPAAAPASTTPAASRNSNSEDVTMAVPCAIVDPQVPPPLADDEDLPPVVVGSEPWHAHLPQNWLPVITRDIARQRRQSPQGPFTDAYISGMSSKRRKLIAETKPPSDVPSLIADGVRQAFHGAGINPASAVPSAGGGGGGAAGAAGASGASLDELANTIADDAALNSSYCEAMRASVRERLAKDPNYDAKRFPNCSKYFEK